MNINLSVLKNIRCRFGCHDPIGIYHVPLGALPYLDPVQALCEHHLYGIERHRVVEVILDLKNPSKTRRKRSIEHASPES